MAGLQASDIDYINLHGTATHSNDAAEGKAVHALFGASTPCSSTKGATGHTLGAAGGVEAVICALALQHGLLPAGLNTGNSTRRSISIMCWRIARNRWRACSAIRWIRRHQLQSDFGRADSL